MNRLYSKILFCAVLSQIVLLLSSCEKEEEPEAIDPIAVIKSNLVTDGLRWSLKEAEGYCRYKNSPENNKEWSGKPADDFFHGKYMFYSDGYSFKELEPNGFQVMGEGEWTVSETHLFLDYAVEDAVKRDTFEIVSLTFTDMVLRQTQRNDTIDFYNLMTYHKE